VTPGIASITRNGSPKTPGICLTSLVPAEIALGSARCPTTRTCSIGRLSSGATVGGEDGGAVGRSGVGGGGACPVRHDRG
jgi:hypothetical protein